MNKEAFVESFMEGAVLGKHDGEITDTQFRSLLGILYDERQKTKQAVERIEQMDEDFASAQIKVKCRCCEEYYTLDYEISEFTTDMSYCGGSPRCCP